jgi:hypothetical protein
MKLPHRRQFLHLTAGAAALPVVPRFARAPAVTEFDSQAVFGSIHATCLSPLVTTRATEAWYHPSMA